jgi:transcriptional regulator with XRE-family HTH domain
MEALAGWLRGELAAGGLSQNAAATRAGVAAATVSDILNQKHVPRVETLFRLADLFQAPREDVLRLAAGMPLEEGVAVGQGYLVDELLAEFRRVPEGWKEVAIAHVRTLARLASQPEYRLIGEDGPGDEGGV